MKHVNIIPLLIAALAFLAVTVSANDRYTEAMQKNIEVVYKAKSVEEIQAAVHAFERIGDAEKSKWEPFYYAAYGHLMIALRVDDPATKDKQLDRALETLEKASAVNPGESEIVALEGFIHMIRVSVDPASRGQQYSGLAMQTFGKAIAMDPENPRALVLMAQMQYGTAQFFGAPATEACGTLNKALEKFETYKSTNPLAPVWGKQIAKGMKAQCKSH
jgi:tetratricopeptide (TPR) repeat protein